MIAIDTNVLVRYLVRDDPKQAHRAKACIDRLEESEDRAFVSEIVLCELAWVLKSRYGFSRDDIAQTLSQLAAARQLSFDSTDNIIRAIKSFRSGAGDFADYLIRESARAAVGDVVATFDRKLHTEEMFVSP
jgi:predicted nucleic-acid-binding protein